MSSSSKKLFHHTIKPGDTLKLIAKKYNTSVYDIVYSNPWLNPSNFYVGQVISIYAPNVRPYEKTQNNCITKSILTLRETMRMLWEQHITWTRAAIIAIIQDTPDKELVINRLLRNPEDLGAALETFYGSDNAKTFTDLLKDHLIIASQLINAAKEGDANKLEDANNKWYINADQIAAFLSGINPNWDKEELLEMLNEHLDLTKEEAMLRFNKEYKKDIELYDEMERQILEMADFLTDGIVKQFPNKFLK